MHVVRAVTQHSERRLHSEEQFSMQVATPPPRVARTTWYHTQTPCILRRGRARPATHVVNRVV